MDHKIKNIYNLTPMQKGMLFHYLLDNNSQQYIEQVRIKVKQDIDVDIFREVTNRIVGNHDVLRTKFVYEDIDNPVQVVLEEQEINVPFINLEDMENDEKQDVLLNYNQEQIAIGFDLSKDCLQRIVIYKLGKEEYSVTWTFHHIIMDGWTLEKLVQEFMETYKSIFNGLPVIKKTAPDFSTYISWLEEKDYDTSIKYWGNYLSSYNNRAMIPKNVDQSDETAKRQTFDFTIPELEAEHIFNLVSREEVTFSNFIHGVWGILLQKYNGVNDVVFGSVMANRPADLEGIGDTAGIFINTVPCRIKCEESDSFRDILYRLKDEIGSNMEHGHVGLWDVQKETELGNTLIDNILVLENFILDPSEEGAADSTKLEIESTEVTNYDLDLNIYVDKGILFRINYNPKVYSNATFLRLEKHVTHIINQIVGNVGIKVVEIELQNQSDLLEEIMHFNDNPLLVPAEQRLHKLFEEMASIYSEKTAVRMKDKSLTYKELNHKANILARKFRETGIEKDNTVGILMNRSIEMVISILAAWKAGGGYIPIEPDYPEDRIMGILRDSGCQVVVVDNEEMEMKIREKYQFSILNLLDHSIFGEATDHTNLNIDVGFYDLAYVIYTSGSTGKPKGAMIEHGGMLNHIYAKINDLCLNENSVVAQTASHCFDISIWQFFVALACGGTTIIYDNDSVLATDTFIHKIKEDRISILELVPTYLEVFAKEIRDLKQGLEDLNYLLVTGEEAKSKLAADWFATCPDIPLVNAYGPTEASDDITHCIMHQYNNEDTIPIGYPINNLNIYIVDSEMKLCPVGIKGEILVSGVGVGRGYLNDTKRTKEVFGIDPFLKGEIRLYHTGDIGRWKSNGVIEYFGRKDFQVKIRGFRIELGEIESAIISSNNIENAIVIDKIDEEGNKYLCAFITSLQSVEEEQIKSYLASKLPGYMVPQEIVFLDKFPTTSNGKIDRKALQNYKCNTSGQKPIEKSALSEIELTKEQTILLESWKQVFKNQSIHIYDNFFSIGGDSIRAIQITSGLIKKGYRLSVVELLKYVTIAECSKHMKKEVEEIDQRPVQGPVELTAIQHHFIREVYREGQHYNQSLLLYSLDPVVVEKLEEAFTILVTHHDALRMQYEILDEIPSQFNQGVQNLNCGIKTYDLSPYKNVEEEIKSLTKECQQSIHLEDSQLMKMEVYHTEEGSYIFAVAHHMVVDGISWRIILEDLEDIYSQILIGNTPHMPAKTVSFQKWSEGIQTFCNGNNILDREAEYWRNVHRHSVRELPVDHRVIHRYASDIKSVGCCLSETDTGHLLKDINTAYHTDINDILLAALSGTMTRMTEGSDIRLHLEGHGRESIENMNISRTVGWFTTLYPVILKAHDKDQMEDLIVATKETLRGIPNKGIGYGLLKYINKEKDLADVPMTPELIFNYLGQFDVAGSDRFHVTNVTTASDKGELIEEPYKIYFNSYISEGCFHMELKFNEMEYEPETITDLAENYMSYLRSIINHCLSKEGQTYTVSDFDNENLSAEELSIILESVEK